MTKRKRQCCSAQPAAARGRNSYSGYTLPDGGGSVDCITMQQALDGDFVRDYVRQRRPVLVQGTPPGVHPQLADPSFLGARCRLFLAVCFCRVYGRTPVPLTKSFIEPLRCFTFTY